MLLLSWIPRPLSSLPEWMHPWVVATSIVFLLIVVAWAVRQRTH